MACGKRIITLKLHSFLYYYFIEDRSLTRSYLLVLLGIFTKCKSACIDSLRSLTTLQARSSFSIFLVATLIPWLPYKSMWDFRKVSRKVISKLNEIQLIALKLKNILFFFFYSFRFLDSCHCCYIKIQIK